MALVHDLDALLPQTQCTECGYSGCFPYAQALVEGRAQINQCPPGGVPVLQALGAALGIDPSPYEAEVLAATRAPSVAVIREPECIGCTKCIKACPVDAIIGSAKTMHAIISQECTGCGLCVAPCPVDCIEMVQQPAALYDKELARNRAHAKTVRLLREADEKAQSYREKKRLAQQDSSKEDKQTKQAYIEAALARVIAKNKA